MFTRSLRNVVNVDPGFRENGIVVVSFNPQPQVPAEQRIQFVRQLVERLRHAPGAESVSEATLVPIGNGSWDDAVWLEGGIRSQKIVSLFNRVSPGYFETLGTRLLAGRDFTDFDGHDAPRVAIVNEEFVRKLAPDTNVVGRYLRVEAGVAGGGERYEIVGVVQSTKFRNLKEGFSPIVFYPAGQDADPDPKVEGPPPIGGGTMGTNIIIRSELPMASWIEPVKRIVAELAPSLTMSFAQLGGMIHASTVPERLMATLAGFFGVLAAAMAALGLYGVVSYGVARRTREIGIRMALGADLRKVSSMVLRETLELVAIGLGAGVMLGLLSTRAAASMLYGLAPHDPLTLAMAVVLTAIVALAASILPAYRAARMDPMVALREE